MGKNLISQKRGKGSSTYKSKSFKYAGKVSHKKHSEQEKKGIVQGEIIDIVHSSGHYAPIIKATYEDNTSSLEIAQLGAKVGDKILAGKKAGVKNGNVIPLSEIPEGQLVYNIESIPGDGGKFVRSSGNFARVVSKQSSKVTLILPSKKERSFHPSCRAKIGTIAGGGRKEKPILKAGIMTKRKNARGKLYPRTSALSMNAVDHPFGGSSSSNKGKPTIARKHAPAGAKVGMIRPKQSGRGKGRRK